MFTNYTYETSVRYTPKVSTGNSMTATAQD